MDYENVKCTCVAGSLLDLNFHLPECAKKKSYEHECMVTHNYYKQGFKDGYQTAIDDNF